ncbi:ATP-binding cassette domain-containing protein [Planctomicrobium piriforme]|nr:ATP-binding cassette domain-containing protein [Planctomicrobium piriforme]
MDQFGIDFEQGEHIIARDLQFSVQPGSVVLFTGESGSGKSSLLRSAAEQLKAAGARVISLADLTLDDRCLVDLLPGAVADGLALLAACGLGEAQLMLRTPSELSDGQRYRFLLALAVSQQADWIVADEFTATLDRRLARVIASNLSRLANRTGIGFLLVTTHEDIVDDLAADVHIRCRLDGEIEVTTSDGDLKKKRCGSPTSSGSPPRPSPTGRTSLGGIIAATASG